MKFQVLENGKPATLPCLEWDNFEHETLLGAQQYAHSWLGEFAPLEYLEMDKPFFYSGTGDFVVIKRVEE